MKKKVISIICASALLGSCNTNAKTTDDIKKVNFDVEFHRGGRNARPENTMYSYLYAIEQGATTIECDMQLLKNGEIVLSHEPLADPNNFRYVSDGKFVPEVDPQYREDIRDMTVDQIKKTYDVAKLNPSTSYYKDHGVNQKNPEHAEIPTIDELFLLVKNCGRKVQINIETKIYRDIKVEPRARVDLKDEHVEYFVKYLNDKVKEYGLEGQVILQSFDWLALVKMKEINPNFKTSALSSSQPPYWGIDDYLRPGQDGASPYLAGLDIDDFDGNPVKALAFLNKKYGHKVADIFSPYCIELTADLVKEAHENGMEVLPWNANDNEEINRMIDIGVDGIISDNGELLYNIALSRGYTLFSKYPMPDSPYHLN